MVYFVDKKEIFFFVSFEDAKEISLFSLTPSEKEKEIPGRRNRQEYRVPRQLQCQRTPTARRSFRRFQWTRGDA